MPIKVKCPNADCGKVATVKDEFAGKRAKCPACGTIMTIPNGAGAAAAPAAARPAAPPPAGVQAPPPAARQRPAAPPPVAAEGHEEGAEAWGGPPAPKSGLVTAVAVINFVMGGLALVCGLLGFVSASMFTGLSAAAASTAPMLTMQVPQDPGGAPKIEMPKIDQEEFNRKMREAQQQFGKAFDKEFSKGRAAVSGALAFLGTLIMILSLLNILWGGGAIAGGIGLLKRQNWGRLVTMVLAGVAGGVALIYLITIFMGAPIMMVFPSILIYGAYAGFVFFVLLKPEIRREFA
jgi:ribosomal protein S27E